MEKRLNFLIQHLMKYSLFFALIVCLFYNCSTTTPLNNSVPITDKDDMTASISDMVAKQISVSTKSELQNALVNAEPGDIITIANGVYDDLQIKIRKSGTEDNPITLKAESPGEVILQGQSDLQLGGDYIVVEGLYFTNGFSPSRAVITFALQDTVANHCVVTNCVIKDYNKMQRNHQDLWVMFKGRHNQMDHCYLAGKSNRGPTIRVDLAGNRNINNYHKIIHNHFGPRPPKGGPSAETIQIGDSYTSMSPSYTLVANNLFDQCNGEVEVISSKTNFNEFRNNVFYKSEGSLVTRHGNYCTVDGNYFIGDDDSENYGGVRLIGTGHTVTNNYFYKLKGSAFRSPLAVMNGIPKSPLNRYIQVTDVTVAHNSWIDCTAPLQFGVGSNVSQKDVLPASEIRSARPIRTVVANNLIHNSKGDNTPIVAHDLLDGIQFESNVINNQGVDFEFVDGVEVLSFGLKGLGNNIYAPTAGFADVAVYQGFGFEEFNKDLFGASRAENNSIGAIAGSPLSAPSILDRSKYGTDWFAPEKAGSTSNTHTVNNTQNLITAIDKAAEGDVIELSEGIYDIPASLKINKAVTIQSKDADVTLSYTGAAGTPLFEMNPNGKLILKGIHLVGQQTQHAFASLKENMSSLYNLTLENCQVENFDYILKAYKYSFSEHIILVGSTFKNCQNGFELSEETEDKGEYNAENITIKECTFENIASNVVDYYRGGYDESTVGGNLSVTNSTFTQCGAKEKNGVLLNTYGIINVAISNNTFTNNGVELVALLWGAKNNTHSNNTIKNSGKILVEENLKLKLFY